MNLNNLIRFILTVCAFGLSQQVVLDNSMLKSYGFSSKSTAIQLTAKNITSIQPNLFKGFNKVKVFYLDSNNISSIDSSSFAGLLIMNLF